MIALTAADTAAVALWVGVIAYAVFGGADFGAGFWDLVAGGPQRGERPRALIDHAISPVWEANHVWLIYCLVMLWTAFPPAFTAIMTTLTVPLGLAGVGIVLRGAGFAFRKVSVGVSRRRIYGAAFAISSVLTPFAMGTVAGGVASGRVPLGNARGDRWTSWLNPTSVLGGTLAVAVCAYLAAVLLVADARRADDRRLVRYFVRRAVGAAIVTGVIATVGVFVLRADARHLADGLLRGRALPMVIASLLLGAVALTLLVRIGHLDSRASALIRAIAAAAVAAVVGAWGVAQYPDLLPGTITIAHAGAPSTTLGWLIGVAVVAAVLVVPSLALLYVLDQRDLLGDVPSGPRSCQLTSADREAVRYRAAMRNASAPAIDLVSTGSYAHGHPLEQYAWLRRNDPVHWHDEPGGPGFWAITKYDDVRTISRQPRQFSSFARGVMMAEPDEASLPALRLMMLYMDPPDHDRFKLLVSRGFTPRNAERLVERAAALSRDIVDDVVERGECDLVHDVTGRLPSGLIAELMGMPREDGERLYELTEIMHTTDNAVVTAERRDAAIGEMLAYGQQIADRKRRDPGDDIASALVTAEVDGDRLTDAEFQWFFLLLVNAGGDTTRNLLAAGMQLLFDHPDQRARLTADLDGLLPTAIEEMLRCTTPVVEFRRTAMSDVELRGTKIAAGDKVVVFYGSANRDEDVFADPDVFDVGRTPNPHLAFGGGGPHLCLGMHVARIEAAAMLRELLTRMPDLAPAGPPTPLGSHFIAGPRTMPVRFTPGRRLG